MANKLAPKGANAPRSLSRTPHPLSWIKRRARCLALVYQIDRREAVASAAVDWHMFNPTATH